MTRHHTANLIILGGLVLSLAGCGHSIGDRAASGGLLGAATGAGLTVLTGGAPLLGAVIGGAAGALAGAATKSHDVDLGRPLWR